MVGMKKTTMLLIGLVVLFSAVFIVVAEDMAEGQYCTGYYRQ